MAIVPMVSPRLGRRQLTSMKRISVTACPRPLAAQTALLLFAAMGVSQEVAPKALIAEPIFARYRLLWANQDGDLVGQVSVGGEQVAFDGVARKQWNDRKAKELALGRGWAVFSCTEPVKVGRAKLKPGTYLLAAKRTAKGVQLLWFEAEKALEGGVDPTQMHKARPVARCVLRKSKRGEPSQLAWSILQGKKRGTATLQMDFGEATYSSELQASSMKKAEGEVAFDPRSASLLGSPGDPGAQARIDHGVLFWSKEHATGLKAGATWRLGKDWWTSMCTNRRL